MQTTDSILHDPVTGSLFDGPVRNHTNKMNPHRAERLISKLLALSHELSVDLNDQNNRCTWWEWQGEVGHSIILLEQAESLTDLFRRVALNHPGLYQRIQYAVILEVTGPAHFSVQEHACFTGANFTFAG